MFLWFISRFEFFVIEKAGNSIFNEVVRLRFLTFENYFGELEFVNIKLKKTRLILFTDADFDFAARKSDYIDPQESEFCFGDGVRQFFGGAVK